MKEFKVNEFITLKLERRKTTIFIGSERFSQCKSLFLIDPIKRDKILKIKSVDDIIDNDMEEDLIPAEIGITPEEEFWGHCSNLQAWCEYNYDTRLLHSNLAFPLLKKLIEVGDIEANKVFKEEIGKKFIMGNISTRLFLLKEGYMDYLNKEEINLMIKQIDLKKIIELKLGECRYSKIPEIISLFKYLNILDLDSNFITFLPDSISKLKLLRKLNLYNNRLNELSVSIGELDLLEVLELGNNKITQLPEEIGNLRLLERINLSENKISTLPSSITRLKSLKEINLSYNNFTEFPYQLVELPLIETIELSNNQISELPESLSKLSKLEVLDLSNNNLSKLPSSIGFMKSLKWLSLSNNRLRLIPESIGRLKNLEFLNLSNNLFTEIPESIIKIKTLKKYFL